ncbi:hypothetical protein DSECCO2_57220 [anaerobic digester metagenome]
MKRADVYSLSCASAIEKTKRMFFPAYADISVDVVYIGVVALYPMLFGFVGLR